MAFCDGMPVAALVAGELRPMAGMEALDPDRQAAVRRALLREPGGDGGYLHGRPQAVGAV